MNGPIRIVRREDNQEPHEDQDHHRKKADRRRNTITTKVNKQENKMNAKNAQMYNTSFTYSIRPFPYATFKLPLIGEVPPERARIYKEMTPTEFASMRELYHQLGIFEAPPQVNFNYETALRALGSSGLSYSLLQLFHLMYGPCIDPTYWVLDRDSKGEMKMHHGLTIIDMLPPHMYRKLDGAVNYVRDTGKPCCCFVGVHPIKGKTGHAIMVVLYKMKVADFVCAVLLDPHMGDAGFDYTAPLMVYLSQQKDLNVIVGATVAHDNMYQQLNRSTQTSLDPGGYCALWVCLMMEIFANNVTSGMSVNSHDDILKATLLPVLIDPKRPLLWRKLIVDYTFSRMMTVYQVSEELTEDLCSQGQCTKDAIASAFIKKYVDVIDTTGIKADLMRRLGDSRGKLFREAISSIRKYSSPEARYARHMALI